MNLFYDTRALWGRQSGLAHATAQIAETPSDTIYGVKRMQESYEALIGSSDYDDSRLWADAWCAAFVWRKTKAFPYPITEDVFRKIEANPASIPDWMRGEIKRLAGQYQFFHWHLAFPDVFRVPTGDELPENEATGWRGGFDVVLGNPPWERLQFEERTFFADRQPEIYNEPSQAKRRKMIQGLKDHSPVLYNAWTNARRQVEAEANFLRSSRRFPLSTADKFNLYAVFSDLALELYNLKGRGGIIVKAGFITDKLCSELFAHTLKSGNLAMQILRFAMSGAFSRAVCA
jgi:hypothetical protein